MMKKSSWVLVFICFGFMACIDLIRTFNVVPYIQVIWPSKGAPEDQLVSGEETSLTLEMKTNVDIIEAFIEEQKVKLTYDKKEAYIERKIVVPIILLTTIGRVKIDDLFISGTTWGERHYPMAEIEEIKLYDLTLPPLTSSGSKKVSLVGWLNGSGIEETIEIRFAPEKLDKLASDFIRNWWSLNGKSLRFGDNTVRWKSKAPELIPYIQKTTEILSRWWLGAIQFKEDPAAPNVIIEGGDRIHSISEEKFGIIRGGTIFVTREILNLPEESILLCIAHEFGHILGIATAASEDLGHPRDDSFMGMTHFRWHPYQKKAAYLVYSNPPQTVF